MIVWGMWHIKRNDGKVAVVSSRVDHLEKLFHPDRVPIVRLPIADFSLLHLGMVNTVIRANLDDKQLPQPALVGRENEQTAIAIERRMRDIASSTKVSQAPHRGILIRRPFENVHALAYALVAGVVIRGKRDVLPDGRPRGVFGNRVAAAKPLPFANVFAGIDERGIERGIQDVQQTRPNAGAAAFAKDAARAARFYVFDAVRLAFQRNGKRLGGGIVQCLNAGAVGIHHEPVRAKERTAVTRALENNFPDERAA